jgi:hypothetical protein
MLGDKTLPQISKESANQIAINFLKKEKNSEKIDIALVEEKSDGYVIRGTCPIDLEGHQWAEKFAVVIDWKGKVKSTNYALL